MARVVGLDIGARHVRLVEVDGNARGLKVLRLGEREIAPTPEGGDPEDSVREAVDTLFRDTRAGRGEPVLSWHAESCVLRELNVPFREDDQIRKTVKFEFESHLHSRAIEDVVVDFIRTADTREGSRLLVIGAPKPPIRARLASLARAKVDPVAVDLDLAALVEGAAAAGALPAEGGVVLVDVGTRSTKIVLCAGGRIRSARAIRGGMESLAAAIEGDLGTPGAGDRALEGPRPDDLMAVPGAAAAEEIPAGERSAASLEVAVVEDRRTDFLDRLCREVTRTLANAEPGITFSSMLLTGRGSRVAGVRARLAESLGMEVAPLDLFGKIAHPIPPELLEEANATYAAALGAAARGLQAGPVSLDFRREDLSYARRFDQVKGGLAVALFLLLAAVGILLWRVKLEDENWASEFARLAATLGTRRDQVETQYGADVGKEQLAKLPKPSDDPRDAVPSAVKRAQKMNGTLKNELGLSTEVPAIVSCLETFKAVNGAVRSVRDKINHCRTAEEIYDQREVKITLVVSEIKDLDLLKGAFAALKDDKGAPLFTDPTYGQVKQDKDGRYPVTFTMPLAKPEKTE